MDGLLAGCCRHVGGVDRWRLLAHHGATQYNRADLLCYPTLGQMMRVLMITQKVDYTDDILGFTHDWITTLARHVDYLDVVAMQVGKYDLPDNVTVTSMGKENGRGRPGILQGFYGGLLRHIRAADAIFAHMIPRYVWLAAPIAAVYRKPITLWYTHRNPSLELRVALPLVRHVATAHPSSFPLETPKMRSFGHGINVKVFHPGDELPEQPPLIVSLARLSPIKHHETLIRAAAILRDKYDDPPARFVIAGGRVSNAPPEYPDLLQSEIERLRVGDRVTMWGAIPADGVVGVFHNASLAFNGSPPGLFDKAVLEGMLCAVPTVVANAAFDETLGDHADLLRIPDGADAEALADRLARLLALTPEARHEIGLGLHDRTAAGHSLDHLMQCLAELLVS
jgi:glycosyltransferase involved in cell wall biosynthesis